MHTHRHKDTDKQDEDNSNISAGFVYENAHCMIQSTAHRVKKTYVILVP